MKFRKNKEFLIANCSMLWAQNRDELFTKTPEMITREEFYFLYFQTAPVVFSRVSREVFNSEMTAWY